MSNNKRYANDLYTDDQVRRVLEGSGIDIQKELDTDFIIFCPYHNNFRTPAGEVSKTKGESSIATSIEAAHFKALVVLAFAAPRIAENWKDQSFH